MRISYRTVMLLAYYGDSEARDFISRWKLRNASDLYWEWEPDAYQTDNRLGNITVSNLPQKKKQ